MFSDETSYSRVFNCADYESELRFLKLEHFWTEIFSTFRPRSNIFLFQLRPQNRIPRHRIPKKVHKNHFFGIFNMSFALIKKFYYIKITFYNLYILTWAFLENNPSNFCSSLLRIANSEMKNLNK